MKTKNRRILEMSALLVGLVAGILTIRKHLKDADKQS